MKKGSSSYIHENKQGQFIFSSKLKKDKRIKKILKKLRRK